MRDVSRQRWDFSGPGEREKLAAAVAASIVFCYALCLAMKYMAFDWIVDSRGRPVLQDFVAFRAAGLSALKGMALAAYDAHRQHAAEVAVAGRPFETIFGWYYPPLFLFVAAALASLPYSTAFLVWTVGTALIYAGVAAAIAGRRAAFLIALAAPWTPLTMLPGQNGLLTAALIGAALLQLEKRPALAGLVLGLASYKPQFGVLIPLALAAGGYWRAFAWAAAGTLGWNLVAGIVFGFDTFGAFLHAMSVAADNHLAVVGLGWNRLLSAFGLARAFGAPAGVAWGLQALASTGCAAIVVVCWRASVSYELKAAVLCAAVLLATPYVLNYDLPILAMAVAFLFRDRAFDKTELALLAFAVFAIFPAPPFPLAISTSLAVGAIAVRRSVRLASVPRLSPALR